MRVFHATCLGLALVTVAACDKPPLEPNPTTLRGPLTLVAPASGERFVQNDPTIGCPSHAARGHGFRLAFDWQDVAGAQRYGVYLRQLNATYPAINYQVTDSEHEVLWCNAFVIDPNLDDWVWRVAAIGETDADTLWSEERAYGFEPCRLGDGRPCYAPPDTTAP